MYLQVIFIDGGVNLVKLFLIMFFVELQKDLPMLAKCAVQFVPAQLVLELGSDLAQLSLLPHHAIINPNHTKPKTSREQITSKKDVAVNCNFGVSPVAQQNYQMKKETEDTAQSQKLKTQTNPESNPRRAATKLKEMQMHIEIMRNRFKVIEGHDQYQRYRTIDQEKRIDYHNSVHQKISKEKEQLRLSLEKNNETAQIREKNKIIRNQIREGLKEARKSLMESRQERSQVIAQELVEYEKKIKEFRDKDWETNHQKKLQVIEGEQKKRSKLKQHYEHKIMSTIMNKSKDSSYLAKETNSLTQEYQKMVQFEKKLLEDSNRSLQASQVMKGRFNDLITLSGRNRSSKLPQIRKQSNGAKTANSDLLPS